MNVFSFLTLNIDGDDRNVFPYLTYDERYRMDVSRLDQWEIVFEHADRLGMYLHFKMSETENEMLLDNGDTGVQRKLYYRELIARFGHHLALNWNLGEENGALGDIEPEHATTQSDGPVPPRPRPVRPPDRDPQRPAAGRPAGRRVRS